MKRSEYRMNLDFLEEYDHSTTGYEVFDVVATPNGAPMLLMVSKRSEPAAWSIVGNLFSVHFLSHAHLMDYIKKRGMMRWTDELDRSSNICGAHNGIPLIF